jgi:hypothetical protein
MTAAGFGSPPFAFSAAGNLPFSPETDWQISHVSKTKRAAIKLGGKARRR